jgi:hypothetical protein
MEVIFILLINVFHHFTSRVFSWILNTGHRSVSCERNFIRLSFTPPPPVASSVLQHRRSTNDAVDSNHRLAVAHHLRRIKGVPTTGQSSPQPFLTPSVVLEASPAGPPRFSHPPLPSSPQRVMQLFYRTNPVLTIFHNYSPHSSCHGGGHPCRNRLRA